MSPSSKMRVLSIVITLSATWIVDGNDMCSVCSTGEDVGFPKKKIPSIGKCEDAPKFPADSEECETFQKAAAWCGCPGVVQECFLCPDGESSPTPKAEALLFPGKTCLDYEFDASVLTSEECSSNPDLNKNFDLPAFCSCENTSPPRLCELCPGGEVANKNDDSIVPGIKCKDADDILHFFSEKSLCLEYRGIFLFADSCTCKGSSHYPTMEPSMAPTIATPSPSTEPSSTPSLSPEGGSTMTSKKQKKSRRDSEKKFSSKKQSLPKSDWKNRKRYGPNHQKLKEDRYTR